MKKDGIYILVTTGKSKTSFEYRVTYSDDIDSIYTETFEANSSAIKNIFDNCKVFNKEDEAADEALQIYDELRITTEGIGVIYKFEDYTYKQITGDKN